MNTSYEISESSEIRVSVFKILLNNKTQKNCNSLPQGRGKLLHHLGYKLLHLI